MTPPSTTHRSPRRRIHPLWWVLGLFMVVVLGGFGGGYGAARLLQSPATDPPVAVPAQPTTAAPSPVDRPTGPPPPGMCVIVFDIYDRMHDDYFDGGADFSDTRIIAAAHLRELADYYPEPDRSHLIAFSDVIAADAQIAEDDPEAVQEAVRREGDAWLDFNDKAC